MMTSDAPIIFLLDVDNTLLDNDRVTVDLKNHLAEQFGEASQARYWAHFEDLRCELGYADYLGALQRYRIDNPHDAHFVGMSSFLLNYPFKNRLFRRALYVIERLNALGQAVILSDGDVVFQPWKIERSGLLAAVENRVLIYVHKEVELADVAARYPASHYVMVDDKLRILTAMKKSWGDRLTTVFVRQGHYAVDPDVLRENPPADIAINCIGDLLQFDRSSFIAPITVEVSQ